MIPRTLVPVDVRPVKNGEAKAARRLETYMDERTLVPSGLPDPSLPPLDGRTTIPSHLPLDVLIDRTLVPRGMPAKPIERFQPITESVPIAVLDSRVVVPAYVEPAAPEEIKGFEHAPEMTAELREVVEPDIFMTGDANLLVRTEAKRDPKWDALTRVLSVVVHVALIAFMLFWPKIFPSHAPTQEDIDLAKKELNFVYLPPEHPVPPTPTPKLNMNREILKRVVPELKPEIPAPAPAPERPPSDLPEAPKPQIPVTPAPAAPSQPMAPAPSHLEPVVPATPNPNHLNLQLPQSSPGKLMQDQLDDAIRRRGGGTYSSQERVPSRSGLQGTPPALGNSVTMLTPTEGVDFTSYLQRWHSATERVLDSILPESFYMGSQGVAIVQFHIMRDGSVPPGEPILIRSSGKEPLDRTAIASIRGASPYEPLPAAFKGPSIELQAAFFFNVDVPEQWK